MKIFNFLREERGLVVSWGCCRAVMTQNIHLKAPERMRRIRISGAFILIPVSFRLWKEPSLTVRKSVHTTPVTPGAEKC